MERLEHFQDHLSASPAAAVAPSSASSSLHGKRVLVTGGSRGIGRAIALKFAARGAHVVVHYAVNETAARQTLSALSGVGHAMIAADVRDAASCERLIARCVAALGGLDILVLNAGVFTPHPCISPSGGEALAFDDWRASFGDAIAVNLIGPANLMFLAARVMAKARGRTSEWCGSIVAVSSRGAFRGEPEAPGYGASKAGLNSLAQSMAKKLGPFGIACSVVAPGFTQTAMAAGVLAGPRGAGIKAESPFNRVAQPEEVADAVLFMAQPSSIFLSGGIVDCNGASYLR